MLFNLAESVSDIWKLVKLQPVDDCNANEVCKNECKIFKAVCQRLLLRDRRPIACQGACSMKEAPEDYKGTEGYSHSALLKVSNANLNSYICMDS